MGSPKFNAMLSSLAILGGFRLASAGCVRQEKPQFNWDNIEYL